MEHFVKVNVLSCIPLGDKLHLHRRLPAFCHRRRLLIESRFDSAKRTTLASYVVVSGFPMIRNCTCMKRTQKVMSICQCSVLVVTFPAQKLTFWGTSSLVWSSKASLESESEKFRSESESLIVDDDDVGVIN